MDAAADSEGTDGEENIDSGEDETSRLERYLLGERVKGNLNSEITDYDSPDRQPHQEFPKMRERTELPG